jgi:hypothetical protein
MMAVVDSFKEKIAADLKKADIPFLRDIPSGGLRLDFLVVRPDGARIVIQAKSWQKHPGFRSRAIVQARMVREAAGAEHVLLVVEHLQRSRSSQGVVTADRLVGVLNELVSGKGALAPTEKRPTEEAVGTIFAAMPFHPKYDDVYFVAMAYAAEAVGAVCRRVDREPVSEDIVTRIKAMIEDSLAVIVDLSESKPNVLYEAGFAHGLGKKTIHICSTPLEELPFDVRNWQTLKYELGQTYEFREQLSAQLKGILGNGG